MKNSKKKNNLIVTREMFIESIYHVVFYGKITSIFYKTSTDIVSKNDVSDFEIHAIQFSMHWNLMIVTVALFDEINKYLGIYKPEENKLEIKINQFKHIVEPVIKAINNWTDIRKFRNHVLAHNFRNDFDDCKSVLLSGKLGDYNVTKSRTDFDILFNYLDIITNITEELFADEYNEAQIVVSNLKNSGGYIQELNSAELEKANLTILEVTKRVNEYNSNLSGLKL